MKPALTAEEWRDLVEYGIPQSHIEIGSMMPRHGIAAWALHEQPFGFTREDVKNLKMSINQSLPWVQSLISRIAALLPPEGVA